MTDPSFPDRKPDAPYRATLRRSAALEAPARPPRTRSAETSRIRSTTRPAVPVQASTSPWS